MTADIAFDTYKGLIAEAIEAIKVDFRYSESIAKQAGTLIQRREARAQKTAA